MKYGKYIVMGILVFIFMLALTIPLGWYHIAMGVVLWCVWFPLAIYLASGKTPKKDTRYVREYDPTGMKTYKEKS